MLEIVIKFNKAVSNKSCQKKLIPVRTPRSRLPEKLIAIKLIEKFSVSYETLRYTACSVLHVPAMSQKNPVQTLPS